MTVSLYRKWRPQEFSNLIGQDHIAQTLHHAILSNNVSHAYLFCGPRGTGKTSTARILAKAVNCQSPQRGEPCNKCTSCREITEGRLMDVFEIDAASSRGIDEIRDLREKVKFAPTSGRYKVFIIDEAHMLTKEAFNALLKTLEEPPSHAIFILVTTEVHKIPQTIISRCQRFDFRRISIKDIVKRLAYIAKEEKIKVSDSVLEIIAANAAGGLRDAIGILEQAISYTQGAKGKGEITEEILRVFLGLSDINSINKFIDYLINKDIKSSLELVNQLFQEGYDLEQFCKNIIRFLRDILIVKVGGLSNLIEATSEQIKKIEAFSQRVGLKDLLKIIGIFLKAEKELKNSPIIQLPLEMAVVEVGINSLEESFPKPRINQNENNNGPNKDCSLIVSKKTRTKNISLERIIKDWDKVIDQTKGFNHSLRGILKAGKVCDVVDDVIILSFPYKFHKDRIMEYKNRAIIETIIREVYGVDLKINCVFGEQDNKAKNSQENSGSLDNLKKAVEILGGKIVEE